MNLVKNRKIIFVVSMLLILILALFSSLIIHATSYSPTNIVVNGNAEEGLNNWTVINSGFISSTATDLGVTASPDGGNLFDYYPGTTGTASMYQVVDISDIGPTEVDAGYIKLDLNGYMRKYKSASSDIIKLELLDTSNNLISGGTYQLQGDTADQSNEWQQKGLSIATLPSGTRKLRITLIAKIADTAEAGSDYIEFDGIVLTLTNNDSDPPVVNILSPADNATTVGVDSNLVITFNENVVIGTGKITIKKTLDNTTIETIDVTGSKVTGSGTNTITINPATTLAGETSYYVLIDATAFDDRWGNSFAGISSTTAWNFTTPDVTAPTVSSLSPADNAVNVGVNSNLVITFSENVSVGTGSIVIKKTLDDSTAETIDVTGAKVTGGGTSTITINPSTTLAGETGYYVLIAATAFKDTSGNSYSGISSTTAWNFTTGDTTAPTVSSLSPADNAANVGVNSNLVITFNETVVIGTGNITIKKASDNSTVETIDVTGAKVTGGGTSTITINPETTLAGETGYYVLIAATAFKDTLGNSYAGINSTTAWNFTTADATAPTVSSLSPADNAANVGVNSNLVITFSENVVVGTGSIVIKKTSDDSTVETIDVTGGKVTGGGTNTITINPVTTLAGETGYYMLIDATAFDDATGNSYAGISDKTVWNFTTVDPTPPTITITTPSAVGSTVRTGSIVIANISDSGSGIDPNSIEVRLGGVASTGSSRISGNTLYHILQLTLPDGTYTLEVTAKDYAGNTFTATVSIEWKNYRKGFGFGRLRFD
jgi:methionine-rich copper-binding protein CopC